jgi:hypothetical protein
VVATFSGLRQKKIAGPLNFPSKIWSLILLLDLIIVEWMFWAYFSGFPCFSGRFCMKISDAHCIVPGAFVKGILGATPS